MVPPAVVSSLLRRILFCDRFLGGGENFYLLYLVARRFLFFLTVYKILLFFLVSYFCVNKMRLRKKKKNKETSERNKKMKNK